MNQYYVAVKPRTTNITHCEIIRCATPPSDEVYGDKYLYMFGGYRTKRKAVQVAMYQGYAIDNYKTIIYK